MTEPVAAGCRFCRHPCGSHSPISKVRLWPTRTSAGAQLDEPERFYPLHAYVCELLPRPAAGVESPEEIFADYAYFSSFSDSWVEHARGYVEAMIHRFGLGARAPSSRSPATTATCCSSSSGAASRCWGSSRPPTSPRSPRSAGSHAGRVLRPRAGDAARAARAGRPICSSATTCSRTCPTSTTSSAGMQDAARAGGRDHDGVPAPAAADRGEPVRHHLPRALLVLLVARGRADLRAHTA